MNTNTQLSETFNETDATQSNLEATLEATILPVENSIDWIIPTALILERAPLSELSDNKVSDINLTDNNLIENYEYQGKVIPVVTLSTDEKAGATKTLIVLEGERDNQRLGVIIKGKVSNKSFKVTEIKDVEQADVDFLNSSEPTKPILSDSNCDNGDDNNKIESKLFNLSDYILHVVSINDQKYAVPNLHQLVEQSSNR